MSAWSIPADGARPARLLLCSAILLLIALSPVRAGADGIAPLEPRNAISISYPGIMTFVVLFVFFDPFWAQYTPATITYERVIIDHFAVSISVAGWLLSRTSSVGGFVTWAEIDWHPDHAGLRGFLLGLATSAEFNFAGSATLVLFDGVGPIIGWDVPLQNNWFWRFALGGTFAALSETTSFAMRLDLGLGYQF